MNKRIGIALLALIPVLLVVNSLDFPGLGTVAWVFTFCLLIFSIFMFRRDVGG